MCQMCEAVLNMHWNVHRDRQGITRLNLLSRKQTIVALKKRNEDCQNDTQKEKVEKDYNE